MIFGRSDDVDKTFAHVAKILAYCVTAGNIYFSWGYLMNTLRIQSNDAKFIASGVLAVSVSVVEAAVFTAMFNPGVMGKVLGRPREVLTNPDPNVPKFSANFQMLALAGFCILAGLAFWFDYNATINQMGVSNTLEARLIAAIFVTGGEVMFGCSNVFELSSAHNKPAGQTTQTIPRKD